MAYTTNYYTVFLQYSFDLLKYRRLALRPLVQVGAAISERFGQDLEVIVRDEQHPGFWHNSGDTHDIRATYAQHQGIAFTLGLGCAFEWEVVDDYLSLGTSLKIVGSPSNRVVVYDVVYQYNNEPPLAFETAVGLLSIYANAYLRVYF